MDPLRGLGMCVEAPSMTRLGSTTGQLKTWCTLQGLMHQGGLSWYSSEQGLGFRV